MFWVRVGRWWFYTREYPHQGTHWWVSGCLNRALVYTSLLCKQQLHPTSGGIARAFPGGRFTLLKGWIEDKNEKCLRENGGSFGKNIKESGTLVHLALWLWGWLCPWTLPSKLHLNSKMSAEWLDCITCIHCDMVKGNKSDVISTNFLLPSFLIGL